MFIPKSVATTTTKNNRKVIDYLQLFRFPYIRFTHIYFNDSSFEMGKQLLNISDFVLPNADKLIIFFFLIKNK